MVVGPVAPSVSRASELVTLPASCHLTCHIGAGVTCWWHRTIRWTAGLASPKPSGLALSDGCPVTCVIPDEPGSPDHASHRPVKPCALPDDIQLVYADDHDRRRVVRLEEADGIDFGRTISFRQPPAYRGQRNFPGWWWSATNRSHVVYESWLERHHIVEADRDPKIVLITGQPIRADLARRQEACAAHA